MIISEDHDGVSQGFLQYQAILVNKSKEHKRTEHDIHWKVHAQSMPKVFFYKMIGTALKTEKNDS